MGEIRSEALESFSTLFSPVIVAGLREAAVYRGRMLIKFRVARVGCSFKF